ncbi:hypothetical protein P9112_011550 [Eukaryota sp. TZLM1-RC]
MTSRACFKEIPDYLKCKRCSHVIASENPQVTPCCQHLLCDFCVEDVLKERPIGLIRCPNCRSTFSKSELRPCPVELNEMLDSLSYKCPQCGKELDRTTLEQHFISETTECDLPKDYCTSPSTTPVCICDKCRVWVSRSDYEHHKQSCPENKIQCPQCGTMTTIRQLENHKETKCPESEITCSASDVGCSYRTKRRLMNEHEERCPLVRLRSQMVVLENQLRETRFRNQELERESEWMRQRLGETKEVRRRYSIHQFPMEEAGIGREESGERQSKTHHQRFIPFTASREQPM